MSAIITLGSTLGGLVLLIIIGVVVITGSQANQEASKQAALDSEAARIQSEKNNEYIQHLHGIMDKFVEKWNNRINTSNSINNQTQAKIDAGVQNILKNLTSHRVVTNETFDDIQYILNTTTALTSDTYNKAAEKKVENILGNMTAEHEIIFHALNISKTDKTTDAENDTENLGQLLKDFIQDQKVKQNKPQGSKS